MHEGKQEVYSRLLYHESPLLSIVDRLKSDARLSSLVDAVTATQQAFGDELLESPPNFAVVLAPTATGNDEFNWDFEDMS